MSLQHTNKPEQNQRPYSRDTSPVTKAAWLLKDIEHAKLKILSEILLQYELFPGQPRLMHLIHAHPGSTQKEVAELMRVSPSSLSMSIKRLEKAGLVSREVPDSDQRRNLLYLTPKGERILASCHQGMIDMHESMFTGLSKTEREQFYGLLRRVMDNLNVHPLNPRSLEAADRAETPGVSSGDEDEFTKLETENKP